MSLGDRYTPSSYRKIFGDSPRSSVSSARMSSASPRGSPGLRSMAASRNGASVMNLYRRVGRPIDSLDLTQTSVVNSEFKVIRTNEKEQLQVGATGWTKWFTLCKNIYLQVFLFDWSNGLFSSKYTHLTAYSFRYHEVAFTGHNLLRIGMKLISCSE